MDTELEPPPLWTAQEAELICQLPYDAMALLTGHPHWERLAKKVSTLSTKAQYVLNYYAKDEPIKLMVGVVIGEMTLLFVQGLVGEWQEWQRRRLTAPRAAPAAAPTTPA